MPGRKRTRRRKFSFVLDKACDERTRPQYYDTLKDQFFRHALAPERTKALVFVFFFVFVLAHKQAISTKLDISRFFCYFKIHVTKVYSSDNMPCLRKSPVNLRLNNYSVSVSGVSGGMAQPKKSFTVFVQAQSLPLLKIVTPSMELC